MHIISKLVSSIIVGILATAISRGVVTFSGLDKLVAGLISTAATSGQIEAIAWVISGLLGLIALMGWYIFAVPELFQTYFHQTPQYASLAYEFATMELNKCSEEGHADVRMSVDLRNKNEKPIKYTSILRSIVNHVSPNPTMISIEGIIPAGDKQSLIGNWVRNVPPNSGCSQVPVFDGVLKYDIIPTADFIDRLFRAPISAFRLI